jgi:hypothetical protein
VFENIQQQYPNKPIIVILIQAEAEGVARILNIATKLRIPVFINEVERAIKGLSLLLEYHDYRCPEKNIRSEKI